MSWVSGSNRESLTEEHSGQYHASCTLKIFFVDFKRRVRALERLQKTKLFVPPPTLHTFSVAVESRDQVEPPPPPSF